MTDAELEDWAREHVCEIWPRDEREAARAILTVLARQPASREGEALAVLRRLFKIVNRDVPVSSHSDALSLAMSDAQNLLAQAQTGDRA